MKVEKNKIVFASVLVMVLVFIVSYSWLTFGKKEEQQLDANKIPVPKIEKAATQYQNRLEAVEAMKKEKNYTPPSLYDERYLDSTGSYDKNNLQKRKQALIDSIYFNEQLVYETKEYQNIPLETSDNSLSARPHQKDSLPIPDIKESDPDQEQERLNKAKAIALEQQLFFASEPNENSDQQELLSDPFILVTVDGDQKIRPNSRMQLRLNQRARIGGRYIEAHTKLYGFISFKPNRAIISIENMNHQPIQLSAYDLSDGSEGIYIENSFRAEATQQIIGDMVDEINITGVPQVSGLKSLFQKQNRQVKVFVHDGYQLYLRPSKPKTKWTGIPANHQKQKALMELYNKL